MLLYNIEQQGWDVLPQNGRLDAIHATCNREANRGPGSKIKRLNTRPILWELTSIGKEFVKDFLIENPNITPGMSGK